jgi:hypothetical protein
LEQGGQAGKSGDVLSGDRGLVDEVRGGPPTLFGHFEDRRRS